MVTAIFIILAMILLAVGVACIIQADNASPSLVCLDLNELILTHMSKCLSADNCLLSGL